MGKFPDDAKVVSVSRIDKESDNKASECFKLPLYIMCNIHQNATSTVP